MHIFYAADHEPFPGNKLWHNNLYLPLVDLGHQVTQFDYDLTPHIHHADLLNPEHQIFIEQYRPLLEKALLEQIEAVHREQPIDMFFSYFYSAFCRPEVIRAIKELGIITVNWYCNASYQFHLVEDIAPAYDFCLVPEKFRLDDYRRAGATPIYCQEAANPNIYKAYDVPYTFDITFVGQKYGNRPAHIKHLLDAGLDAHVWGPGWQELLHPPWKRVMQEIKDRIRRRDVGVRIPSSHCGPPLTDHELLRMYSRSKINLGFSTVAGKQANEEPIKQVRLRDFEATMSGAFYVVEYFEELSEFFDPGKEIVFFYDRDDLVDKAKWYLAHPEEREQIRRAGMRRAREEHTWHKRFTMVFEQIGVSAKGSAQ